MKQNTMDTKGNTASGGVFTTIMVGALVLSIIGLSLSTIMSEGNTNYGLNANTTTLDSFNQVNQVSNLTSSMNNAFNTNSTTTGSTFANSFDTVFALGLTISRLAASIPGIYINIISSAVEQIGAPLWITNIAALAIILIVISIFLALLLGKYL